MQDIKTIIDIGNGYIKGILLGKEDGEEQILAKDIIKTRGLRKGKILDAEEFAHCINELLESFARKLGGDFVEEAVIGVSHPDCLVRRVHEYQRILDGQITHDDIQHLSDVVSTSGVQSNYEVVKIIPVQRVIDERTRVKDPLGMEARNVELIADVFMLPRTFSTNLYEAFDRLDVHVVDIVPNILGASEVCLDFDVKDLGTLLVDIGANQTSYVVYEEGFPLLYGVLPMGGEDVTKDISIGLQVDIKDAERIKREKGEFHLERKPTADDTIDLAFLGDIMTARYEEIFDLINEHLIAVNKDGRLPGGVIMIGGGTKVKNIEFLAKDVFKLAVFPGEAKGSDLGDLTRNLQFISVLGDAVWSSKYQQKKKPIFAMNMNFGAFRGIGDFFKKMF